MIQIKKTQSQTLQDCPLSDRNLMNGQHQLNSLKVLESGSKAVSQTKSISYMNSSKWSEIQIIPTSLKMTLTKRNHMNVRAAEQKQSALGFFQNLFNRCLQIKKSCQICDKKDKQFAFVKIFKCSHYMCFRCAELYILYKIKMQEQVLCPHKGCNSILDWNNQIYQNLTQDLKKKYQYTDQFYSNLHNNKLRLCMTKDCEGVMQLDKNLPLICNKCKIEYCQKCHLRKHEGSCDQKQREFYRIQLHLVECPNCQRFIQINDINQIRCECNFEFQRNFNLKEKITPQQLQQIQPIESIPSDNATNNRCTIQKAQQNFSGPVFQPKRHSETASPNNSSQSDQTKSTKLGNGCWNCLIFFLIKIISLPVLLFALIFILIALIWAAIFVFPFRYISDHWRQGMYLIAISLVILYPITVIYALWYGVDHKWCDASIIWIDKTLITPVNTCLYSCFSLCFRQ